MLALGGRYDHRIDLGPRNRLQVIGGVKLRADAAGQLLGVIADEVGDADKMNRRMGQRLTRADGTDAAAADDGNAELLAFDDVLPGLKGAPTMRGGVDSTGGRAGRNGTSRRAGRGWSPQAIERQAAADRCDGGGPRPTPRVLDTAPTNSQPALLA